MSIDHLDSLRIVLDPTGQVGVAMALMLVMFGVALGLRVDDFRSLLKMPTVFAGGVAAQVLALPLITFALLNLISLPPFIALGMIVVACCPGGVVSNLLTYRAEGEVAVSIALTATLSMLAALLTPASILFWSQSYATCYLTAIVGDQSVIVRRSNNFVAGLAIGGGNAISC
jgi:BASS family bile acid:Na+ symporter